MSNAPSLTATWNVTSAASFFFSFTSTRFTSGRNSGYASKSRITSRSSSGDTNVSSVVFATGMMITLPLRAGAGADALGQLLDVVVRGIAVASALERFARFVELAALEVRFREIDGVLRLVLGARSTVVEPAGV